MGDDGHTASLFPGPISTAEQDHPVLAVTATYEDRPARRVTLTPLVFNEAQQIWVMVTGEKKAGTVAGALRGPYQPEKLPIQRIRPTHGTITWMLDDAAAQQLELA
jgi:6-phosphogluconolactonase